MEERRQSLKQSDGPPRPVVVRLRCTPCDPCDEKSTQVPETVVYGSEDTTVLRMADLGKKNRRAHLGERVTETKDETATHVDLPVRREGRDKGTSNHDGAADGDWNLTSGPLGQEGNEEEADDRTDVVHVVHETQAVTGRLIKVVLPSAHLLRRVHHHAEDGQQLPLHYWKLHSPVITSSGGGNAKDRRVPEQLSHVWVLVPNDLLELRHILADGTVALGGSDVHTDHLE